jgi:hypothetical protein
MSKAWTAAASTALALALGAGVSAAHDTNAGGGVTDLVAERFQGNPNAATEIHGRVNSKRASCERSRRVSAYHDVLPPGPGPEDFLLGSGFTNKDGEFSLGTTFQPDKVYVVVAKRTLRGGDHRHKCRAIASGTVPVGSYK